MNATTTKQAPFAGAMTGKQQRILHLLGYFVARLPGRRCGKLHLLKLLFFADRFNLRMQGAPLSWDTYWAMKYGPVPSTTRSMIEGMVPGGAFANPYLHAEMTGGHETLVLDRTPDMSFISQTDQEALDAALRLFVQCDLVAYSHVFPEWKKPAESLGGRITRRKMDYADFFEDAPPGAEFCPAGKQLVEMNRDAFLETSFLMLPRR